MTNNEKDRAEEIKIIRQMMEWSSDLSLDIDSTFRDSLYELSKNLTECFGFLEMDAVHTTVITSWDCILCDTTNTLETDYHEDFWNDECTECGCSYSLMPPDF